MSNEEGFVDNGGTDYGMQDDGHTEPLQQYSVPISPGLPGAYCGPLWEDMSGGSGSSQPPPVRGLTLAHVTAADPHGDRAYTDAEIIRGRTLIPHGIIAVADFRSLDGALAEGTPTVGEGEVVLTAAYDFTPSGHQPSVITDGAFRLQAAGDPEAGAVHTGPYVDNAATFLTFSDDVPVEIGVLHAGFLDDEDPGDLWDSGAGEPRRSSTNVTLFNTAGDGYTIQANTEGDGAGNASTTLALYRRVASALGTPLAEFDLGRVISDTTPDRYHLNVVPDGAVTRLFGMLNGRVVMEAVDPDPHALSDITTITHTHGNSHNSYPVTAGKWRPGSFATWIRRGETVAEDLRGDVDVVAARAGTYTVGLHIPAPIEGLEFQPGVPPSFDGDGNFVLPGIAPFLPFPGSALLSGQTDWQDNATFLTTPTTVSDLTLVRAPEAFQPMRVRNVGRQLVASSIQGSPIAAENNTSQSYTIRTTTSNDEDVFLARNDSYTPAEGDDWPDGVPDYIPDALDTLAARTGADVPLTAPDGSGNLTAAVDDVQALADEVDALTLADPPPDWPIIPDSRFVKSPDAGYGTPLVPFDSVGGAVAVAAGASVLAPSRYRITDTIAVLLFETTASGLLGGQSVNIVCYNADEHGLPSTLRWSKPHVVGTAVQVHNVPIVGGDGVSFPTDDGATFFLGIHNPFTNGGTVTLRGVRSTMTRWSGAAGAAFGGIITNNGQTTPDADLGTYLLHSAANTATRLGVAQIVPWVGARS